MADTYTQVKDIVVNIAISAATGSVGLGNPLVIVGNAEAAVDYKECNGLDDVVAAGYAMGTETYKACALLFGQADKPKTVAVVTTDGTIAAWLLANKTKNFRHIVPIIGAGETLADIIAVVNTLEDKMLFATVKTKAEIPTTKSERVVCVVYNGASEYANAAVVGAAAGLAAGSYTYKNLILTGIEPEELGAAAVQEIHDAGGFCIVKKAGDVVTSEGITTDGEYIDILDSKDYIISNIVYQGQKLLNDNKKLSFDNVGISMLENVVTNVLADAYNIGIVATTDDGEADYSTNFAGRNEVSASDRAARKYKGGKFRFGLAGAIHNADVNGTIEV